MEDDLDQGVARLQNKPPNPTTDHLRALIKSKGVEPPPKNAKKLVLQRLWKKLKDKENWERTIFFEPSDQQELDRLKELWFELSKPN